MAINRVEIKDFLLFKGEFAVDFCPSVNVLIGGNGTGKTTLMKIMYGLINQKLASCFYSRNLKDNISYGKGHIKLIFDTEWSTIFEQGAFSDEAYINPLTGRIEKDGGGTSSQIIEGPPRTPMGYFENRSVYIPEKDMLSHSPGFLALKHERPAVPFDDTLTDIIAKAQLYPKKETMNNELCARIREIIGGEVAFENDSFIILKDKTKNQVSFSMEASGYRKLGVLWKLLRNGLLESGSILFWDEPENSLNPENVSMLVEMLLELSRNGVQIFLATHNEILASYIAVNRQKGDSVMFISLYKDGDQIIANKSDRFDLLEPNSLTAEPVKLYEKELERGLGGNG